MADKVNVLFQRGTKAEIDEVPMREGQVLWTTDQDNNNKIYTDVNGERIRIGGTIDVDNEISTESSNAIANNVITNYVNNQVDSVDTKLNNFETEINNTIQIQQTPTYIVDSNQKLDDWANNVTTEGQDYSIVLIKQGYWTLSKPINLDKTKTYRIIGESSNNNKDGSSSLSVIKVNFDYSNGILYKEKLDEECDMQIADIRFFIGKAQQGIVNCSNITNVYFYTFDEWRPLSIRCFHNCKNIINCGSYLMQDSETPLKVNYVTFNYCENVINSFGIFYGCNKIINCGLNPKNTTNKKALSTYKQCNYLSNCIGFYYEDCSYLNNCNSTNEIYQGVYDQSKSYKPTSGSATTDYFTRYRDCNNMNNCSLYMYKTFIDGEGSKISIACVGGCSYVINCHFKLKVDYDKSISSYPSVFIMSNSFHTMNCLFEVEDNTKQAGASDGTVWASSGTLSTNRIADTADGGFNQTIKTQF